MKKILMLCVAFIAISMAGIAQENARIDTNQIERLEIIRANTDYRFDNQNQNAILRYFIPRYRLRMKYGTEIRIFSTKNNSIYYVTLRNLTTGKIDFRSNSWESDSLNRSASITISPKYYKAPWKYNLQIIPVVKVDGKGYSINSKSIDLENPFKGYHYVYKRTARSRMSSNIILCVSFLFMTAVILYSRKKSKLIKARQEKEKAQLQLEAVRSQLNPHFLFNALAGIQNLMNSNETEQANRYLTRFSRLTRAVLRTEELISLEEEKRLLDDYLQMEQLRFGFTYTLWLDAELNLPNIDIPSMLLQPFLENAVKHGVAGLGRAGVIEVSGIKQGNDLVFTIMDNGKGFDTTKMFEGLGFTLSNKRIVLLNKIYKHSPIHLEMKSDPQMTKITLNLTKWL